MSVAEEIKAKVDIVDLIAAEVQLKRSGSSFKAPCPFHAEKTPSFIVNPDRQTWHCFGACSEGGDIFSWEMKRHNVDFREALQRLAQRAGVQLRPRTPEQAQKDEQRQRLIRANDAALHFWRAQLQDASDRSRGAGLSARAGISAECRSALQPGPGRLGVGRLGAPPLGPRPPSRRCRGGRSHLEHRERPARSIPRPTDLPDPQWSWRDRRIRRPHPDRRAGQIHQHTRIRTLPQARSAVRSRPGSFGHP